MQPALLCLAVLAGGSAMSRAADRSLPPAADLPARPGLPDPLTMLDGSKVATAEGWRSRRKPELKALFEHYMYGTAPAAPPLRAVPCGEAAPCLGGKATWREVLVGLGPEGAGMLRLLVVVPARRAGPVAAFLGVNFHGNHTALAEPGIALPSGWMPPNAPGVVETKATDAGRGADAAVWSVEKVVDAGYALALFYAGDVAPDHPGFADGVFPAYAGGAAGRGPGGWGAVAAWAWGLARAVDYLQTDPAIDPRRIAVVGHSRMGKAALLAGAFDDRVALTIAHQAGCGGSAPSRGVVGEQVAQINARFPHWFADRFRDFGDRVDRLPFDQNDLIALAAPRPVLLTNANGDTWANPFGQFEALKAADPAYRLFGVAGIDPGQAMPPIGPIVGDRLGYQIREGKHSMTPDDWDVFLRFADRHLVAPTKDRP